MALAVALAAQSCATYAVNFTLDLDAFASAAIDGSAPLTESDSGTTYVDADVSVYDGGGESWGGSSYADANATGWDDGSFYMYADGGGTYDSLATFTQTYAVTNDPVDSFFDFTFNIENGSIDVYCGDDGYGEYGYGQLDGYGGGGCTAPDMATAAYAAEIFLDGTSIWNSSASISLSSGGIATAFDGEMLGTYYGDNYYYWSEQSHTIDLGLIGAGETFELEYVVSVATTGFDPDPEYYYSNVSSYAQFGDPTGFNTTPFTTTPAPAPIPAPLSLLGLGALALLGTRRTRQS